MCVKQTHSCATRAQHARNRLALMMISVLVVSSLCVTLLYLKTFVVAIGFRTHQQNVGGHGKELGGLASHRKA